MSDKNRIIYSSGLFGEYSPYYVIKDGKAKIYDTVKEAIKDNQPSNYKLDVAAVLSLLNFNYILGDRTLVSGISKVPWHSDITIEGKVLRRPPIPHDDILLDEDIVAKRMYEILSTHLYEDVIKKHSIIWLTLSGGYDSRLVAGIIKKIVTRKNEVRVLNWGIENSRDVVYARKIAEHYGWEYIYIPYDHRYNIDTIKHVVEECGAEFSPIDYNPIEINPSILKKINPQDAIIFSHYGDAIGKGKAVQPGIRRKGLKKIHNPYFLFNLKLYRQHKTIIDFDRSQAWVTDGSKQNTKRTAIIELDMHENCLRRMLTKRFKFANKYIPFAYVDLVKFVYSLSPNCRNDKIYSYLLKKIDKFLYDLPYANTGRSFTGIREKDHSLTQKQHNKLSDYLKFYDKIKCHLLNGYLKNNNVINKNALDHVLTLWPKDIKLSMLLSKLYSIELFINSFDLEVPSLDKRDISHIESFFGARGYNLLRKGKQLASSCKKK